MTQSFTKKLFKCILKYQITYHIYLHLSCNYEYVKLLYKKKLHVHIQPLLLILIDVTCLYQIINNMVNILG